MNSEAIGNPTTKTIRIKRGSAYLRIYIYIYVYVSLKRRKKKRTVLKRLNQWKNLVQKEMLVIHVMMEVIIR